jgi:hypothetical protein
LHADHEDHIFRFKYRELLDLVSVTGLTVTKEHWQKPPYGNVLYLLARKATC